MAFKPGLIFYYKLGAPAGVRVMDVTGVTVSHSVSQVKNRWNQTAVF